MKRREFAVTTGVLIGMTLFRAQQVWALSLADISSSDATKGLKAALNKGASSAISLLGTKDGFLGNEKVRIGIPKSLEGAANLMRTFGQGARIDELVNTMNRAAEMAVPEATGLLSNAIQTMTVEDAKGILGGGDTSVTQFFESKTRTPLTGKFLPIVTETTSKLDLASKYDQLAGKAADMGLIKGDEANVEKYVTGKSLDGLYLMIGEEERKIRQNPVAAGSAILSKVFGAL